MSNELVDCVKKAIGIYESAPMCTGALFGFDNDLRNNIQKFAVAGNFYDYPAALEAAVADSMQSVPMCVEGAIYLAAWRATGNIPATECLGDKSISAVNKRTSRALFLDHDAGRDELVHDALYGYVEW